MNSLGIYKNNDLNKIKSITHKKKYKIKIITNKKSEYLPTFLSNKSASRSLSYNNSIENLSLPNFQQHKSKEKAICHSIENLSSVINKNPILSPSLHNQNINLMNQFNSIKLTSDLDYFQISSQKSKYKFQQTFLNKVKVNHFQEHLNNLKSSFFKNYRIEISKNAIELKKKEKDKINLLTYKSAAFF